MGIFLNSRIPFDSYKALASETYFIDKSALIAELLPALGTSQRFFCITRPRRFGKSVMANMVGAFFERTADAGTIFSSLQIASPEISRRLNHTGCKNCHAYLNQYDIIYIDFSEVPENCVSYNTYITRILQGLKKDLSESFAEYNIDINLSVWEIPLCQRGAAV